MLVTIDFVFELVFRIVKRKLEIEESPIRDHFACHCSLSVFSNINCHLRSIEAQTSPLTTKLNNSLSYSSPHKLLPLPLIIPPINYSPINYFSLNYSPQFPIIITNLSPTQYTACRLCCWPHPHHVPQKSCTPDNRPDKIVVSNSRISPSP